MNGVLHVITGLGTGGAETMLAQLSAGLQECGLPQHVVSLRGGGEHVATLSAAGVAVTSLDVSSPLGLPLVQIKLAQLVGRTNPAILQGWMYHGNIAAAVAHRMARGPHRRLFWNIRASNMDAARYARIIGWSARLSRWPDLVIANSQAGMTFHLQCGFQPRESVVIPNGIDTDKFKPDPAARKQVRREWGVGEDHVVAILVARVDVMKDHAMFLSAIRGQNGIKGILVGKDTDTLTLPDNVSALGLRHDVARLCAAADIIVSSSAHGEGFSNAVAEGMSAGLVPVVTRVGDSAAIVGRTGVAVEPGDAEGLAEALHSIASLPPGERRARGRRARERIVRNYTIAHAIDAYERLYREGNPPRPLVE